MVVESFVLFGDMHILGTSTLLSVKAIHKGKGLDIMYIVPLLFLNSSLENLVHDFNSGGGASAGAKTRTSLILHSDVA